MNAFPEVACPVWGLQESLAKTVSRPALKYKLFYSPKAGGLFRVDLPLLKNENNLTWQGQKLTDRHKGNLSYWVYRKNWKNGLLQPLPYPEQIRWKALEMHDNPHDQGDGRDGAVPLITEQVLLNQSLAQPPTTERLHSFLQELLWQQDKPLPHDRELQYNTFKDYALFWWAAAGWATVQEEEEFWSLVTSHYGVSISADRLPQYLSVPLTTRMQLEELGHMSGKNQQGFVAMWFDKSMEEAYLSGIAPAVNQAGYSPLRIDKQPHFLGDVTDRIMAEIQQSRFVVADFTCCHSGSEAQGNARGGVYYEAGFARGLSIPVIHTCRRKCLNHLHFDIRQENHLLWDSPSDLCTQLRDRINVLLGPGPLASKT